MDTAHPAPDASIAQRRADFKALHAGGCFMLPNPWDAGSARYLQSLGFQLAHAASGGFMRAAQALQAGRFDGLGGAAQGEQPNGLFRGA